MKVHIWNSHFQKLSFQWLHWLQTYRKRWSMNLNYSALYVWMCLMYNGVKLFTIYFRFDAERILTMLVTSEILDFGNCNFFTFCVLEEMIMGPLLGKWSLSFRTLIGIVQSHSWEVTFINIGCWQWVWYSSSCTEVGCISWEWYFTLMDSLVSTMREYWLWKITLGYPSLRHGNFIFSVTFITTLLNYPFEVMQLW